MHVNICIHASKVDQAMARCKAKVGSFWKNKESLCESTTICRIRKLSVPWMCVLRCEKPLSRREWRTMGDGVQKCYDARLNLLLNCIQLWDKLVGQIFASVRGLLS